MSEKKGLYYYVNKRKKAGTSRSKNNPKAPSDADWKNAAKTAKVSEAIVDHAGSADSDHEVQMARADLYNIAEKALKLHKILKNISEEEGLQGWQQSKITKAADYMDSVFSSLNYETMSTMATVQTRPASNGSVGVSATMSESEVADYKALLEKATSKAQQKFMGMVHAAQKGEKPASKEVAKVAKSMPKKAAKDFAATKHKGLPAHVKENDDDDNSEVGGIAKRQAGSRAQATAWRQDADARSRAALEKYPDFFTDEHMDRVDAINDIIERVLTPSKVYITHRFGGKEGPFTAISIYDPTWPRTLGVSKSARTREFYKPIEDLGGMYDKPLQSGAAGFIIHVII